jgi:hypothetical protein
MLILLKQTPTGIYAYPPDIPENEVCTAVYFDTVTKTIYTSGTVGGGSFEMATGQLVWTDPSNGDVYTYDGMEGVDLTAGLGPEPAKTFTLILKTNPRGSTLPILDLSPAGPYVEGAEVDISILVAGGGWEFLNWTLDGEEESAIHDFTFTMPGADTILVANFQPIEDPVYPGEPSTVPVTSFVPSSFYPLEIRVNRTQIPISGITNNINTGIFTDEMEGDYSFPLNIPVTEAISVALNLPNDPQSIWEFSKAIPAELWSHGNRSYRGHLNIMDADEKSIKATFVFDSGFFIDQNKSRSIRDCYGDADTITLDEPKYAVGGYELRFNFRDMRLTVNGTAKLFLKASYPDHLTMLDDMADYLEGLPINLKVTVQYSEDLTDESSRIIVWDTNIVSTITLAPVTGTSRYSRARRLTNERYIMNAWDSVDESKRIAFPTIYNRELYEGNNQLHDGIVNRYDSEGRLYFGNISYLTYSESFRWENVIIPFLYLTDVVKTVFAKLNIQVSGSFFDDDRVKRMLLYNNRTLDFVQISVNGTPSRRTAVAIHWGDGNPDQETYRYQNVHDFNIKLKNHVPDYPIITFLKALKNYFGLKYDFNILQNRVEIRFIRDVIRSMETLDMTRKSSRVFKLSHGKEEGFNFVYEPKDPLLADGQPKSEPDPDYNVTNFLALDTLDAEIGETAFVRSLRAFFTLTTDQDNPPFWKLTAFMQRDDSAGNPPQGGQGGRRSWTIGMVPLVDGLFDGRKMPAIEMTANNPEVNLNNEDTGIRIFAFYGKQLDASNQPYSFASCTRYNAKELASSNQFDLDIRSEDSYPFFKDLEAIIDRGKEYETNLILNDSDIVNLSKTRRIRIVNIDYLIDKMEITHSERDYALAKVKMWKISLTRPANKPDVFSTVNDGFDYDFDFDLD